MRHIAGTALSVIFASYLLVTALFTHTHYINYRLVTHCHPYQSATHNHTAADIAILEFVSPAPFVMSDNIEVAAPEYTLVTSVLPAAEEGFAVSVAGCISLRAPPHC